MQSEILYEDRDIIVCYKPAGIAVQSADIGQMDMVSELKNYLKTSYLGLVHRLDQPVEGILLFAKNKKSASVLSRQLQKDILNKKYLAAVYGQMEKKQGVLKDYLIKDSKLRMAKIVTENEKNAKEAILFYEEKMSDKECSLLSVTIQTGRFHQIRAQLSGQGCPVLGDRKYGNTESMKMSQKLQVKNVALCANEISFLHPLTGKQLQFRIRPRGEIFKKFS